MAFNMNRPIIKGTALHKASIAKAKTVVAQTRTKADASLVRAGELLGESYKPDSIDYTIDQPELKIPKKKEKEEPETPEVKVKKVKKVKKVEKVEKNKELTPGQYYTPGTISDDFDVEAVNAETMRIEEERQAKIQAKIAANEAKKAEKEAKKTAKQIKKEEDEKKNIEIRKRNQEKDEARAYFGPDVKLTQPKLDEYREIIKAEEGFEEIPEQDDPEWWQIEQQEREKETKLEKIAYKPQILPDEPATTATRKPKSSDYRWGGTGGWKYKGEDKYKTDLENWKQSQSPIDMRDDRIWKNAIKNGTVHENMRKSGYVPRDEQ